LTIGRVQVDRHSSERAAPLNHRGVVVRVGDRDGRNPAEPIQQVDGRFVDQGDAVPQHVPRWRARQDRTLPDAKAGGGFNRGKSRRKMPEFVCM
jgi:hypothetical protein